MHDLTSTIGLQEADIQIDALMLGIDTIIGDDRLIGLKNRDGVTASDVRSYISRFRAIYFEPLFLAAFQTDSSLSKVYERDIKVEMRKIDSEISELNARLDSLQRNKMRADSESRGQEFAAGLDGGALSQVVSLAEQASSARYLQATLEKRFQLVEEKANLQARFRADYANIRCSRGHRRICGNGHGPISNARWWLRRSRFAGQKKSFLR